MPISIIFKISFLVSSVMLISAFYLEYFHGALPCDLCITQRWFHGAIIAYSLMIIFGLNFQFSLPFAVILAASSNFFINNWLTFRSKRLKNKKLILGLLKFLIVSSLPIFANVGLATSFYNYVTPNTFISQMAGIIIVFIWNYAASSRFVWEI